MQGAPASPCWRRSVLGVHWKDWCWGWSSSTLPTLCEEVTHLKQPWCQERLEAGGEGDDRGWDGWMASPTRWTWVWANSGVGDGQGSLACCSPWGCEELDTIEHSTTVAASKEKGQFMVRRDKPTNGFQGKFFKGNIYREGGSSQLPRWLSGQEAVCQCRRHGRCGFSSWVGTVSWSRKWQPIPIFLSGNFHE